MEPLDLSTKEAQNLKSPFSETFSENFHLPLDLSTQKVPKVSPIDYRTKEAYDNCHINL